MTTELQRLSGRVAKRLAAAGRIVVFAESCTGGLVAATLAQIPGVSEHLAGSMVVYQNATKNTWLRIEESTLVRPGPVSQAVASLMAEQVLANTPHADLAASVTGHLGPEAPAKLDGIIYVAVSNRDHGVQPVRTVVHRHSLRNTSRQARQREAAAIVLTAVLQALESETVQNYPTLRPGREFRADAFWLARG